jgi:hypothetical protein
LAQNGFTTANQWSFPLQGFQYGSLRRSRQLRA